MTTRVDTGAGQPPQAGRDIRARIRDIAPLPQTSDPDVADRLSRHLLAATWRLWALRQARPDVPPATAEIAALCHGYAALHAMQALTRANPQLAGESARTIAEAWADGDIGDLLWDHSLFLGIDVEEVTRLAEAELAPPGSPTGVGGAAALRPLVVCLCGSTRFYDECQRANYNLTMQGVIVLSVGFYPHAAAVHGHGEGVGHDSAAKTALDELHRRRIDLADEVLVVSDPGGYFGQSTAGEIAYAAAHGKAVRFAEPAAQARASQAGLITGERAAPGETGTGAAS